jgi:hypothetical protein
MKNNSPCCGAAQDNCLKTCPANFRNVSDKKLRKEMQRKRKQWILENPITRLCFNL